ncbi:MAG: hypothetical protein U5K99_03275 [Anaerolineales bacterium]|nr:hypothetical protein [Anaerolineales bacterium]
MSDYQDKIQSQRGPLKNLLSKVPGFKGYLEKEDRRTADKLLREEVADRYGKILTKVSAVQISLTDQGSLEYLDDLESVVTKVQTFIDRIRNAAYGYSSFFAAVRVDEETLDKLYEYDQSLLAGANKMEEILLSLEAADNEPEVQSLIAELNRQARELINLADNRKNVITTE